MKSSLRAMGAVILSILLALSLTACSCDNGGDNGGDISMITPYVNETDISWVSPFSASDNCPWGFEHRGIDIFTTGNLKPFQAVCSGVVDMVDLFLNPVNSYWQVNVRIIFNSIYSVEYAFEPCGNNQSDGQTQLANILVSEGQAVSQGDIIGYLYTVDAQNAHIDWALLKNGVAICPEPYFTPEARDSILRLIHKDNMGWDMCYDGDGGGGGDTAAPSNVSVMISGGAASTSSPTVELSIAATDNVGVTGYYISETSTTPSATAPGWTSVTSAISYSANVSFILSSGDGTKTIYVWFKDDVGNVSAPGTASITLDTTAPSNVSVMINGGAASTASTTVELSIAAIDNAGVTGYYISETSTTPSATASGWTSVTSTISYSANVSFILSSGDGTKTIYVWFKDDVGNVSAPATASITLASTISMITPYPYINETDYSCHQPFSSIESSPWGRAHNGIDFWATGNLKPFQAVCSGVVNSVELWKNPLNSMWQVNVMIIFNHIYVVDYAFEPATTVQSDGETQLDNIVVSEGQTVSQGEIIGYLYNANEHSHIHFGLCSSHNNWDAICPEPYFTQEARDSILRLIHKDHPGWNMCY